MQFTKATRHPAQSQGFLGPKFQSTISNNANFQIISQAGASNMSETFEFRFQMMHTGSRNGFGSSSLTHAEGAQGDAANVWILRVSRATEVDTMRMAKAPTSGSQPSAGAICMKQMTSMSRALTRTLMTAPPLTPQEIDGSKCQGSDNAADSWDTSSPSLVRHTSDNSNLCNLSSEDDSDDDDAPRICFRGPLHRKTDPFTSYRPWMEDEAEMLSTELIPRRTGRPRLPPNYHFKCVRAAARHLSVVKR